MGQVRTEVYRFMSSDLFVTENQQIYELWETTEEAQWIKKFTLGELEVIEEEGPWGIDMGGGFPLGTVIKVYATFDEKNYLMYKLRWAK